MRLVGTRHSLHRMNVYLVLHKAPVLSTSRQGIRKNDPGMNLVPAAAFSFSHTRSLAAIPTRLFGLWRRSLLSEPKSAPVTSLPEATSSIDQMEMISASCL